MKFLLCCWCWGCCACCWGCWLVRCWVLSTTGNTGRTGCPAALLPVAPAAGWFPLPRGIATNWPATGAWPGCRGPGALATRPKDCSIWGVAARTVPFERKTALTAPDATETGTPLAPVAWTTLIIWGCPVITQIGVSSYKKERWGMKYRLTISILYPNIGNVTSWGCWLCHVFALNFKRNFEGSNYGMKLVGSCVAWHQSTLHFLFSG